MITLPARIMTVLAALIPMFSERIWDWVQVLVLVTGAILTPKKRTVTSILQATGGADTAYFQNYHRVLNRASWSSREVSKILLQLLVTTSVKERPLVSGVDEMLERRRGNRHKRVTIGCGRCYAKSDGGSQVEMQSQCFGHYQKQGAYTRVHPYPFLTLFIEKCL